MQFVVFYNVTRFSRNSPGLFAVMKSLLGWEFRSAADQPLSDDPVGNLTGNIMSAIAQFDNDEKARRTKVGMQAALGRGRWPSRTRLSDT